MSATLELPTLPALVVGHVSHARRRPLHHAFRHRAYQWLVDLDDLPRLPVWLRPLATFRAADHLGHGDPTEVSALRRPFARRHERRTPGAAIRRDVADFLARHHVRLESSDRVLMLANARVLGHVFDPLTVFWVQAADGTQKAVVFEVHNTYGGWHAYLVDLDGDGRGQVDKAFYVSPFNDVSGSYEIRLRIDPEQVSVTVGLDRAGERVLTATTRGTPRPATRGALLRVSLTHLLMTHRVSALIRLHGIRLWLRRLPIVSRTALSKEVTS